MVKEVKEASGDVQVAVVLKSNVWSQERPQWFPFNGTRCSKAQERERNLHFRLHMRLL